VIVCSVKHWFYFSSSLHLCASVFVTDEHLHPGVKLLRYRWQGPILWPLKCAMAVG